MPPIPGGLEALLEDPDVIAQFASAPRFDLPQGEEASAAFRRAQLGGLRGLEGLLAAPPSRSREYEDAMFNESAEDINRAADRTRLTEREGAFGKGVGLSTILNNRLSDVDRERMDALAGARRQAILGAGAEARAQQQAQLAALGQSFSQGTQGLQAEANVGLQNAQNQAQGAQYATSSAGTNLTNRLGREQQASQFTAELGSRENLERERRNLSRDISQQNLLAGGIGAGIGGLASLFRG